MLRSANLVYSEAPEVDYLIGHIRINCAQLACATGLFYFELVAPAIHRIIAYPCFFYFQWVYTQLLGVVERIVLANVLREIQRVLALLYPDDLFDLRSVDALPLEAVDVLALGRAVHVFLRLNRGVALLRARASCFLGVVVVWSVQVFALSALPIGDSFWRLQQLVLVLGEGHVVLHEADELVLVFDLFDLLFALDVLDVHLEALETVLEAAVCHHRPHIELLSFVFLGIVALTSLNLSLISPEFIVQNVQLGHRLRLIDGLVYALLYAYLFDASNQILHFFTVIVVPLLEGVGDVDLVLFVHGH